MSNHCCSCELGRNGKRPREEDVTSTGDRLSRLPEPVLYHILSFLDTKSAVQTSVLSRVWRCAWKYVSVLNFDRNSFQEYSSFQRYLDKVLSLRYPFNLNRVSYIDNEESQELDFPLSSRIVKYALSHDTQHLVIDLYDMWSDTMDSYRFSKLFGTVSNCNIKTLKLRHVALDSAFWLSGFGMLTNLTLEECFLIWDEDGVFFSNCPSLKNLVMNRCVNNVFWEEDCLKLSGPQLFSLKLNCPFLYNMEIFAPRLKFFKVQQGLCYWQEFSKLSIPSLDHAEIRVDAEYGSRLEDVDKELMAHRFISLFQDVKNAMSLMLDSYTIKVLGYVSEFLDQQPSPFTRLESLIVKADSVPFKLANYFLKGSSCMNPNVEIRGRS